MQRRVALHNLLGMSVGWLARHRIIPMRGSGAAPSRVDLLPEDREKEKIVAEDLDTGYGTVAVSMPDGRSIAGNQIGLHTFTRQMNVQDFGAVGDGAADDTAAIQAASLAAGASGIVYFPPSSGTYRCTGLLTISSMSQMWIGAPGVTLHWTALSTTTMGSYGVGTVGLLIAANNFRADNLIFQGPTPAAYANNESLIAMIGTSTSARRSGLTLLSCEVLNVGAYGVFAQFVDQIRIERCFFHNLGYVGAGFVSCNHGWFVNNRVVTIAPGTSGDAYGMFLSHYSARYNMLPNPGLKSATNPFCWDWHVVGNYVEGSVSEGLDAHGAYEVEMSQNNVYGCRVGIALAGGSGEATDYAGSDNRIIGNVIDANHADGTLSGRENHGPGIEVGAGGATGPKHQRVIVGYNIVRNHGIVSAPTLGAIRGHSVMGLLIIGNIVTSWGGHAIVVGAFDTMIADNWIGKLANPGNETEGNAIYIESNSGEVYVRGNVLSAEDGTAATNGFRFVGLTTRPTITGNNFRAATGSQLVPPYAGFNRGQDYVNKIKVSANTSPITIDVSVLTPGVPGVIVFQTTGNITVTDLINGMEDQIVVLKNRTTFNITFTTANARLPDGVNWVGAKDDTLTLSLAAAGGQWQALAKSVNH